MYAQPQTLGVQFEMLMGQWVMGFCVGFLIRSIMEPDEEDSPDDDL